MQAHGDFDHEAPQRRGTNWSALRDESVFGPERQGGIAYERNLGAGGPREVVYFHNLPEAEVEGDLGAMKGFEKGQYFCEDVEGNVRFDCGYYDAILAALDRVRD